MTKLFRNIRQSLLMENKTSKYLKYAIGEIILVMVGILLALQVNNWNEKRKLKQTVNYVLKTIVYDLEADTTTASRVIKFYEDNQKNSIKIIKKEVTKDNYLECIACLSLVTIYQPFNIQTRGFEQLKTLANSQIMQQDSLITDLTKFYSQFRPIIEKNNQRMDDIVMHNFRDFEKQPWFIDLAQANFTDELLTYFTESEDYRKRVTSHSMLAIGNHLGITKQYKNQAEGILNRIKKRISQ